MKASPNISPKKQIPSTKKQIPSTQPNTMIRFTISLCRRMPLPPLALALFVLSLAPGLHAQSTADLNVLIVGSTSDGGDRFGGQSDPFVPTEIATELESILAGAGLGSVNVDVEERYTTANDAFGSSYSYNLASWYHWPYPAGVETTTRWPNLRGELGTAWDYVVLIGDPYTMEKLPGHYAHGVEMIAQEVAKGSAETILLMPWPANGNNQTSVAHYKQLVYRAGRTGGYKVAPAALAWQADGSTTGASHPSTRGAYICAASIYSRIWGQSAKNSTYSYNDNLADNVNGVVTTNVNQADQYTGSKMDFQNPWLMLGDKRREVWYSEKGSSTESYYANRLRGIMPIAGVSYNDSLRDSYTTNNPGWTGDHVPIAWNHGRDGGYKGYVVNPAYWQLAFTFDFQLKSRDYADDLGNDFALARIYSRELNQARGLISKGPTARNIAWRLMWGQFHKKHPTVEPVRDNSWHVASPTESAVGAFIYTLYSGRCPVNPGDTGQHADARMIGYQTAWRLGTCSSRAPGFKVMPSSTTAVSVTPGTTDAMSVQFLFEPRHDVTVTVTSSDPSAGIVGPQTLVFTPANYNVPQTVTIAGVEGMSTSAPFNVVYSTSSDDPAYDELSDSWAYTCERANTGTTHSDSGTTNYSTPKNFAVTTNFGASGANSGNTTLVGAIHGTLAWSGSDVVYTPDTDYVGPDGFAYAYLNGAILTTGYIDIDVIDGYPDGSVRAEVTDSTATEEGVTTGTVTIIRVGDTTTPLSVNFTLSGSATLTDDYTLSASSPVTIPADQSSIDITVTAVDDSVFGEQSETVSITVIAGSGYVEISNPATVSIADNDNNAPVVEAGSYDPVSLISGTSSPGLWYGTASGSMNETAPNPEELLITDLTTYIASIGGNSTEIYTGQIYDADGSISFTENVDDSARIWIDGNLVITNDTWNQRTSTSNLNLSPGWHDIEIRIGNAGGGSGTTTSPGIGFDPNGGTAFVNLVDPGDGSLLQVGAPDAAVVNLDGTVTDAEDTPATVWTLVSSDPVDQTVIFGNPSSVDTTATFSAAGTYVLRLTADDGYGPVSDEVTITVSALPGMYSTWAAGSFANSFTAIGLNENPDGDSNSNMMEFAFGADPTVRDEGIVASDGSAHGKPMMQEGVSAGTYEFVFMRRKDFGQSGSVSYTVQFSADLAGFTDYTDPLTDTTDSTLDATNYEVVKVAYPAGSRFGRVEIETVP
jgi:hypothetical protein